MISAEDAEEYTQALGQVVAGGWRQVALGARLGVPAALGISTPEWVEQRLGGYVRISIPDRRAAVAELLADGFSQRQAADIIGVGQATVNRDALSNEPNDSRQSSLTAHDQHSYETSEPNGSAGAYADALADELIAADPKAVAAADTKTRREVSRAAQELAGAVDLRIGDAREAMDDIADCSINLVLTDPPYGDAAEPLYQWLAQWSARVLMPGGSLICYTGQSRLNRDIKIFDEHLRYWWLLTMKHDRCQRLPGKFVVAESKPVLWYVKHYRRGRSLINDMISSERDKSAHPWAQGSGGVAFLIENLTEPGEFVADPFAGTARWGEITARMGRRWIGCDVVDGGRAEVVA